VFGMMPDVSTDAAIGDVARKPRLRDHRSTVWLNVPA
jgi:hypothetical protein